LHHLKSQLLPGENDFRFRGGEITRLEGFSDAVFAFAVTLLVVSLEVPHTFHELAQVMKGFPAFAICFSMLVQVWYAHSKYFRRYGLQDAYTTFLNAVLLFVVLFYVYPLKFLFTNLIGMITRGAMLPDSQPSVALENPNDARLLMLIYGLGFAAVFALLALLYHNAYRLRTALELNELETFRTKHSLIDNLSMCGIGLISAVIAVVLPRNMAGLAGYAYFFIGIYYWISGNVAGTRERKLKEKMKGSPALVE
jgi:uncharacterized membrane protein